MEFQPCPLCKSTVKWCGENEIDPEDNHLCHHIVCTNPECGADFDFMIKGDLLPEDTDNMTVEEIMQPLRDECQRRFNNRGE